VIGTGGVDRDEHDARSLAAACVGCRQRGPCQQEAGSKYRDNGSEAPGCVMGHRRTPAHAVPAVKLRT
jgi:hypothetical protein